MAESPSSPATPLGAHMSIAGGYYRAVDAAADLAMDCVQVFTKQNARWAAKAITSEQADKFRQSLAEHQIRHSLSHASYLINLGSPDEELRIKSRDALVVELQRASQLGIPYVVFHPGSYTTASEAEGVAHIIQALDEIEAQTGELDSQLLLENTAGQGSNLGWSFEQLADILQGVRSRERLGVCIDTCHLFAAGHALETAQEYADTMERLDQAIGLATVKAFHLNDSKTDFGSRKDRHEHIGQGKMGLEPFRHLLNDPRFVSLPKYLETEKGTNDEGEDFDAMNLRTLRSLIR
ncbi:deoxyribonuclease IV [Lignipirellula cremea]|uniref:Probable endonuclease 4 n=1 Tax=Lignipirellula cremea TaxID=2528010 RepID=A0A518DR15_9BACT|nr:deoxyribonuclease IV [Lignipirellula cremea]QDU94290.1 Endonuclease 4 [Lignipirellula cremea]